MDWIMGREGVERLGEGTGPGVVCTGLAGLGGVGRGAETLRLCICEGVDPGLDLAAGDVPATVCRRVIAGFWVAFVGSGLWLCRPSLFAEGSGLLGAFCGVGICHGDCGFAFAFC